MCTAGTKVVSILLCKYPTLLSFQCIFYAFLSLPLYSPQSLLLCGFIQHEKSHELIFIWFSLLEIANILTQYFGELLHPPIEIFFLQHCYYPIFKNILICLNAKFSILFLSMLLKNIFYLTGTTMQTINLNNIFYLFDGYYNINLTQ